MLGVLGFLYSGVLGFASMGLSFAFRANDLTVLGHVIILVIFVGMGLGSIAWTKQHYGAPLVNVACSLASLGCINILIKGGSVQTGQFSTTLVVQVLFMVMMGIVVATVVNIFVLPITARKQLREDFENNTDLLGELLIGITRAFLSGREQDLQDEYFTKLQKDHQQSLQKMSKNLAEARNENYLIGKEKGYEVSTKVVDCLDGLSQDLGGLRSAAFAQFALIKSYAESHHEAPANVPKTQPTPSSPRKIQRPPASPRKVNDSRSSSVLDIIAETPEEMSTLDQFSNSFAEHPISKVSTLNGTPTADRRTSQGSMAMKSETPSDMFYTFLRQLGPPTKSLVYTLKQILDELPYKQRSSYLSGIQGWLLPEVEVAINENFHLSLRDALELYKTSRKEALNTLYTSRALSAAFAPQDKRRPGAFSGQRQVSDSIGAVKAQTWGSQSTSNQERPAEDVLADIEEVSACCGHFSFSLLDFAEDVLLYLKVLDELRDIMENPRFSWNWLFFWRKSGKQKRPRKFKSTTESPHSDEHGAYINIPEPIRKADDFADQGRLSHGRPWYDYLYRFTRPFRRDDVKFAIKVGIGAIIYSLPAFIESTRPFFVRWRGEWGLVSYMAVCCMTVGASNTTGINRFIGTGIGALLSILAWILAADDGDANPYLLAFFGWLVSVGCFYLILAKDQAPMGRFILLTYNLGALYAYSLSVHYEDAPDEGEISPEIFPIVGHRVIAVLVGAIWSIVVTSLIWPISARRKLKDGLCVLWLRMSLVWRRDPLAVLLLGDPKSSYMDIREEAELQSFFVYLDTLRTAAKSEFELKGPFPEKEIAKIIEMTRRMLDAFHAMNVIITKNLQYTPGEAAVLRYTRDQRFRISARLSHLFSVLASSLKLEYPLNDALPSIEDSRDRLLARISEFRQTDDGRDIATEHDYELIYAYVLVTGQLAQDIQAVSAEIEKLFGTLNEDNLKLQ